MNRLEKLQEIKFALNNLIASRHTYPLNETIEKRLEDNAKYLQMDYEILKEILNLIDEEKKNG